MAAAFHGAMNSMRTLGRKKVAEKGRTLQGRSGIDAPRTTRNAKTPRRKDAMQHRVRGLPKGMIDVCDW